LPTTFDKSRPASTLLELAAAVGWLVGWLVVLTWTEDDTLYQVAL